MGIRMKLVAMAILLGAAGLCAPASAQVSDACAFQLLSVPLHPASTERIGLRLVGGIFGPGAGPAAARATLQSGVIALDVVLTRERGAFPDYHPVGDVILDVLVTLDALPAGVHPVVITTRSFVDGVENVPCPAITQQIRVGQASGPVRTLDAVEYYNASRDRYFVTADAGETGFLDSGGEPGWARTGRSFTVYASGQSDGRALPVERFVSPPGSGLDAHFLTASYREFVAVSRDPAWHLEAQPFDIALPDTLSGECPGRSVPVYRLFNPRNGDHRLITDAALKAVLEAGGWLPEGYGDRGVAMCSPIS